MRLLLITQKADSDDPVLGFMIGWIKVFSERFEKIEVICLEQGRFDLPPNVRVFSLGKESGHSRLKYVFRFYRYIIGLRNDYDAVLVHMNEEYLLLGGLIWKILGKPVYMWRNHYSGSALTDLAASFCRKIFCTSKFSYTAKFKKTVLMPVGVDTGLFRPDQNNRKQRSIVFLARMSRSKRPDLLVAALKKLATQGVQFTADFYGDPPEADRAFYEKLKREEPSLNFYPAIKHADGPKIFSAYEIFVNLSPSGMYDKTLFEAAACGCLVASTSADFSGLVEEQLRLEKAEPQFIAARLEALLNLSAEEKKSLSEKMIALAQEHSLKKLAERLSKEINNG